MPLSYKARRRWSLFILVIGLPAYIVTAVTIMNWLGRPSMWVELAVYVGLGILWALPFKAIFKGIGQADPDETARSLMPMIMLSPSTYAKERFEQPGRRCSGCPLMCTWSRAPAVTRSAVSEPS